MDKKPEKQNDAYEMAMSLLAEAVKKFFKL